MVKLLFYFLQYSLARLNRFNVLFQSEGCNVLELDSEAQELLKVYLLNFVKAELVNESDDVTTINYSSPSNHYSNDTPKILHGCRGHSSHSIMESVYYLQSSPQAPTIHFTGCNSVTIIFNHQAWSVAYDHTSMLIA